ncbi:MAG: hypothetical protein ACFE7A_06880 [Promethearchaeota archaeon]
MAKKNKKEEASNAKKTKETKPKTTKPKTKETKPKTKETKPKTTKPRTRKKPEKKASMPRLVAIGNSVGLVIAKALLESIGWEKGDIIEYWYDEPEKLLSIRNLSAEQREYDVIHKAN